MRRASSATQQTNLKDFGSYSEYGGGGSERNLKAFADAEGPSNSPPAASNPRRGSLFNFSLGFGAELESTQQDIKAKEDAMKAPPISSMAVREHQQSVAEHVVNDEEQWKKFREQMRSGGTKTGMQLKHNLDSLLQTRAQELKTTGADTNFRQRLVRRASIKDFASSLIRGEDRQNRRGSVAVFASISEEAQTNAPASNRTPPRRQNSSSYNGSPRA